MPSKKKKDDEYEDDEELDEDVSDEVTATDVASKEDLEELEELASDDEDEDEDQPQSLVDKIKKQLPILSKLIPSKKKSASDDDDSTNPNIKALEEDDEEEESGKKKKAGGKKPNKLILIVVGIGLVALFAEDFLPSDEAQPEVVTQTPKKKSPRELDKEKRAAEEAAKAAASGETPAETPVETPAEVPTETIATTPEETPVETPTEVTPEVPVEAVVETPVETIPETPSETVTVDEDIVTEPVPNPEPVITMEPDTIDPNVMPPPDNASEDQIGMPNDGLSSGGDFTDKILQDLEKQAEDSEKNTPKTRDYVSPPDYEYTGRGLVYNCVGKHWACVDAPSYKTCEQNSEGNKALGKKAECYPFNVYEKTKNCQSAQLMMTSSNAKTGFCNE